MRKLLLLLLPAAALLTGCFDVQTDYVVNEDGSGSQTLRFAMPAEVIEAFSSMGGEGEFPSAEDLENDPETEALREALGERGSVTFFSDEEQGFGFVMTINVPASDDFSASLEAVLADLPQDAELPIDELSVMSQPPTIQRDGDVWTFVQDMPALSGEDLAALSGDAEGAAFASMFLDDSTITVTLDLPGEVTEHNADEVRDDGTLVWTQQGVDSDRTLTAQSDLSAGGNALRIVLIIAGVLGGAVLISVLAYLATRSSGEDAPVP